MFQSHSRLAERPQLVGLVGTCFVFLLLGCNSKQKPVERSETKSEEEKQLVTTKVDKFDFASFQIVRGQLGPIRVGMSVPEAEQYIKGLTKTEQDAGCFGFDGGGSAFLYSLRDELVFALIPAYGTDSMLCIIAAHKELKTANGLTAKSSVRELVKKYPEFYVVQDLMNGWEFFDDDVNNWTFYFMTDEDHQIGEYPELEKPSKPKRLDIEADWIVIK